MLRRGSIKTRLQSESTLFEEDNKLVSFGLSPEAGQMVWHSVGMKTLSVIPYMKRGKSGFVNACDGVG
jgi:hypothetical protein